MGLQNDSGRQKVQVLIRGYEKTSVISHVANYGGNVQFKIATADGRHGKQKQENETPTDTKYVH
jgi:hypothetical protein